MKPLKLMLAVLSSFGLMLSAAPGQAATAVKLSTHASPSSALFIALSELKNYVEEKTNGKYEIELYDSYKLGSMESSYQGLQVGTVHFLVEGPSNLSNFIPMFQLFDMGFIFPNADIADQVLCGPIGDKILKEATNKVSTPLCFLRNNDRVLWTTKPITSLDDLKGLKLRGSSSKSHIALLKAMGMTPIPMAGSEVYTSLQQGVVEGVDVTLGYGVASRWYEAAPNLFLSNHVYLPQLLYVSTRWWNKLPEEDRAIFEEGIRRYQDKERVLSQAEERDSLKYLAEQGVKITIPTAEQYAQMAEMVKDVPAQFPKVDQALLKELMDAGQAILKNNTAATADTAAAPAADSAAAPAGN